LTPNTPAFNRAFLDSPIFQKSVRRNDETAYAIAEVVHGDDDASSNATMRESFGFASSSVESQEHHDQAYSTGQQIGFDIADDDDVSDCEPRQTRFDKLQQEIRDAELAAQLAENKNTSNKRRSTRLAEKDTAKGKHILVTGTVTR